MGILQPETGLLFWMCISFGVVLLALAKFAFPVILRAIDSRRSYIDASLEDARRAEERIRSIDAESRQMIHEAELERAAILREAAEERDRMVAAARESAEAEGARIVTERRAEAEAEREAILRDARREVALMAVAVSEKLLRERLDNNAEQSRLMERLIDEMEHTQKMS